MAGSRQDRTGDAALELNNLSSEQGAGTGVTDYAAGTSKEQRAGWSCTG